MPARKRRAISRPAGPEFVKHPADPRGLQPGKLHRQGLSGRTDIKQALAAIGARLLHDIAFVDQLLEYAAERLFGDFQDVEQLGDFHTWVAIDEMQDPVVGAAKAELVQHLIRIADEVAVGKEQKLDQVPVGLARFRCAPRPALAAERLLPGDVRLMSAIMSAHIDIFRFDCYPQKRNVTANIAPGSPLREVAGRRKGALIRANATIPGVCVPTQKPKLKHGRSARPNRLCA